MHVLRVAMETQRRHLIQFWGGTVVVREGFLLEVPSKQRPERMSRMNQNISNVAWGKLKSGIYIMVYHFLVSQFLTISLSPYIDIFENLVVFKGLAIHPTGLSMAVLLPLLS